MPLLSRSRRPSIPLVLVALGALAVHAPVSAVGPATLVADLDLDTTDRSSSPRVFHRVGDRVVFAASDPLHGRELRSTGVDATGVELLLDASPGTADSYPIFVAELGDVLVYATGREYQTTLWVTDGTVAGTRRVRDGAGAAIGITSYNGIRMATLGTRLALIGHGATSGVEGIWSISPDGSAVLLRDIDPQTYSAFSGLAATGDHFFWVEEASETFVRSVWRSDGTAAGTTRVADGFGYGFDGSGATLERYFFTGSTPDGDDVVYATDGTAAGTVALASFGGAEGGPRRFESGSARVYFVGGPWNDSRLWVSDGTPAGTFQVPSTPGDYHLTYEGVRGAWAGENFVFKAYGDGGDHYWSHSGAAAPALLLPTAHPERSSWSGFVTLGDRLLFAAPDIEAPGSEVWSTDGTPAGTRPVSNLCPPECYDFGLDSEMQVEDRALFAIVTAESMFYFSWLTGVTDGTEAGTRILNDSEGPVAVWVGQPANAAIVDGGFLVEAEDGLRGAEAWFMGESDGALRAVANLEPETGPSLPRRLRSAGGRLWWVGDEGAGDPRSWSVDGPDATPEPNPQQACRYGIVSAVADFGRHLVFRDDSSWDLGCLAGFDRDTGLWETLVPPAGSDSFNVAEPLLEAAGRVYFQGGGQNLESGLWATDGTAAGTAPFGASGLPRYFDLIGATPTHLFLRGTWEPVAFIAQPLDGGAAEEIAPLALSWTFESGSESVASGPRFYFTSIELDGSELLRVSDGTAAGTRPLWASQGEESRLLDLFPWLDGGIFFLVASERMTLWASDGTLGGTHVVADLGPLANDAEDGLPRESRGHAGRLYFSAENDALGAELWATDGTAAGTVVFDLVPGPGSGAPRHLEVAAETLFFAAESPDSGREVWASDGTPAGTRRVSDIAAGAASAMPEELVAVGTSLYFAADDGFRGRELWAIDTAAEGCVPGERRLCLRDGRFAVEGAWRDFAGNAGPATAVAQGEVSGSFWFFDPANVEAFVKVLDGRPLNDSFWLFYASLSNVEYDLQVTDTRSRVARRYTNPAGRFASVGDVDAFPEATAAWPGAATALPAAWPDAERSVAAAATGLCVPAATRLCLRQGRFAVEARWRDFAGTRGEAGSMPWSDESGAFWFFDDTNLELVVKVLDGTGTNGRHWVFAGALSNVEYTITVTDLLTGAVREYLNPAGVYASFGDVDAF